MFMLPKKCKSDNYLLATCFVESGCSTCMMPVSCHTMLLEKLTPALS